MRKTIKKTYSAIAQAHSVEETAASKKENDQLRSIINDLQARFNAMERKHQTFARDLKATLKTELKKEFGEVLDDFRTEINNTISAIETKFESTISRYEKMQWNARSD